MKPRLKPDSWECRLASPIDWRAMLSCWYGLDQYSLEIDTYCRRLQESPDTAKHCWLAINQHIIDGVAWLMPHSPSLFHCWPVRSRFEPRTRTHLACIVNLWKSVSAYLASLNVNQCQALISTSALDDLTTMESLGFKRVAMIHRMRVNVHHCGYPVKNRSIYLVRVEGKNWHEFQSCFRSTMVNSLDVPELNEIHSGEQLGSQYLDPSLMKYLIFNEIHQMAGVAVLETDETNGVLRYLGIVPECRKQGLATQALQILIEQLKSRSCETVEVRMDARNLPACRLYNRTGFVHLDDEELLIAT